ncbi:MAG: hypothetical protein RL698_334 [Pseudomonadota bacterium]|jgi:Haem-NO-binding
MYGLINTAVKDLIVTRFGADKWEQIVEKAKTGEGNFVLMQKYPDDVTYRLVGAASEVLGAPANDLLEAFGEYWTQYSAEAGFGHLLDFAGDNLVDFLRNLDSMHTRIGMTFTELEPPSFTVSDIQDGSLRLHYRSKRPGLAPVAMGMVRGLGKRFNTPIEIELVRSRESGHDHDEFLVRHGAAASA